MQQGKFQEDLLDSITRGIVVYETIRFYDGIPFALEEHYKRFLNSLSYITENKVSFKEFERYVMKYSSYDRVKVFGIIDGSLKLFALGENFLNNPINEVNIDVSEIRHADPSSIPPNLKSVGRPDLYIARLKKGKYYDVILLGSRGQVCEGSFSNVFFIKDGKVITPSVESGILEGITRKNVIEMLNEFGYEVEERIVELKELFYADEIFLTHTSRGVVPVDSMGKRIFYSKEISLEISRNFEEYINEKIRRGI
ncbi:aminotransferase class IV [Thermosipho atlanticus]|uniref:Branched chain amino acid aminotransferase apoenzyme n=1 Tax=Thermosipho atlanticus DSM 15807 TaxID=1123380 RepID=A0A1M5T5B7_9BACT|nr:aminotransferase class IV [Thermosipho atlanticus]SHH45961.1 branched chain amino acid aminotransferase apoenzyme [Thermosipho atlanticus DSM 15807]